MDTYKDYKSLKEKIRKLKLKKNAIILAHFYQLPEIQEVADFIGDSLELAKKAKETDADIIVVCGVYFMAETAKLLNPTKKVLIPYYKAGCLMADMATKEEILEYKKNNPDTFVVTYVNSSADVKAVSDICCTSANAVKIVEKLVQSGIKKILFVPDKNLGSYIKEKIPKDIKMELWDGYCYVHAQVSKEDVLFYRERFPKCTIVVHPECKKEVRDLADFVGSTSQIVKFVKQTSSDIIVVGTEEGIIHYLKKIAPNKIFYSLHKRFVCDAMKLITLPRLYNCLENEKYEIKLEEKLLKEAKKPIEKMLKLS